jgi:hypothetical protein
VSDDERPLLLQRSLSLRPRSRNQERGRDRSPKRQERQQQQQQQARDPKQQLKRMLLKARQLPTVGQVQVALWWAPAQARHAFAAAECCRQAHGWGRALGCIDEGRR